MANITKAELQDKYDEALETIEQMKRDDAEFRERIVTVAAKAAYDHDLCSVLEDTLDQIGVKIPEVEVIVKTETLYKMPLTDIARYGALSSDVSDDELRDNVKNAIGWGDFDEARATVVEHVTIKQPETQAA